MKVLNDNLFDEMLNLSNREKRNLLTDAFTFFELMEENNNQTTDNMIDIKNNFIKNLKEYVDKNE